MPAAAMPMILPAVIGAGATVAASSIGARSAERQTDQTNAQSQANFERTMTSTVQSRVADAQAAGVSPLAALGVGGVSLPHLQVSRRAGGVANVLSGVGDLAARYMEGQEQRAESQERDRRRAAALDREKTQATIDAVRLQNERHRLEYARRRLQLLGPMATATHQMQPDKNGRWPIYIKGYDNRATLGPIGPGEWYFVHPELGEALEGVTPSILSAGASGDSILRQAGAAVSEGVKSWFAPLLYGTPTPSGSEYQGSWDLPMSP